MLSKAIVVLTWRYFVPPREWFRRWVSRWSLEVDLPPQELPHLRNPRTPTVRRCSSETFLPQFHYSGIGWKVKPKTRAWKFTNSSFASRTTPEDLEKPSQSGNSYFLLLRDDFFQERWTNELIIWSKMVASRALQNRTERFFVNEVWHYFVFMALSSWSELFAKSGIWKDLCDLPCWIGQDREWATERSETQTQLLSLSGQTSSSTPHPTQPCPSHPSSTPRSTQVCPSRGSQILRFNPIAGQIVAH